MKFDAPLGCGVTLTPNPLPLKGKGEYLGARRPCALLGATAPIPVYIDVCGQSYQNVLIYDCRGRPPGCPAAVGSSPQDCDGL